MIPLGLTGSEQSAYHAALLAHHSIKVTVQLLDLDGNRLTDLSGQLLDGQVNIDSTADITRNCTLSLLDPLRTMTFDSDSPADGAIFMDRMLRIIYSVNVPSVGWVDAPVFTGPVSKLDRDDDVINVEAQGKETLASGAAWVTKTYRRNSNKVAVVRSILEDLTGETRFDLPATTARLGSDLSLARTSVPWEVAKRVAASMDRQLFYDGRGVVRMRPYPGNPAFVFATGDGGALIESYPQVSYSTEELVNTAIAKNGKGISEVVFAPRSHPLSPWRLGRKASDGTLVPRYLLGDPIEDHTIRTKAEARAVAASRIADSLMTSVECAAESLPIPHLDPADLLEFRTDEFVVNVRLRQATLPLTVGSTMSLGWLKRSTVNTKRIRRP